ELVDGIFGGTPVEPAPSVELLDWDPEAEDKLLTAICYPHSNLPESQIMAKVKTLGVDERIALIRAYVGDRQNRRHRPGRAFERIDYRFDVVSDYGAFRDLQRHRMLTIDWQPLTPNHGYVRPDLIDTAGMTSVFDESMARSAALYDALRHDFPSQASYAVSMAYRIRYSMQFNAREAMHMLELRSSPQGHPAYRRVALEMHQLIANKAGHTAIAQAMSHMTEEAPELERLESERRAEQRRQQP
ncbi:MAG: putative thymidylate synthase, partial [Ilumatobacteraceae bacterium]|nr:putative thymidylate synthase [Ilumatobacteraceae bacterium]